MPLIRYRSGDMSSFVPGRCPCGSVLRRLAKVRCRQSGLVGLGDSAQISLADLDEALLPLPGVINFSAALAESGGRTKLELRLLSLLPADEKRTRQALASIPAVSSALASGDLDLAVTTREMTDALEASSAKRQIIPISNQKLSSIC
jgi:phenylacetate-coenzyme A ligase PaaK-like adenylate-forming protein